MIEDGEAAQTLVLSGGLGGTHLIWSALARSLRNRYRLVIWEYPGLAAGKSIPRSVPVDVVSLAGYQNAVFQAANVDHATLVGWSLGPQVSLEFLRHNPDMVDALVFVCGVAGSPFVDHDEEPIAVALGLRAAFPNAVTWLSKRLDSIEKLKAMLNRLEHPTRWAKRLGFVDPLVDELLFDAVIRDFIGMDPHVYRRYVHEAASHDAGDMLDTLAVPLLVVAGQKDMLIPPSRAREVSERVEGSSYMEARGGTHFLPLEYPDLLGLKIDEFMKKNQPR